MTKAEYAEYQQTVADFFEREGIANLSSTSIEAFFSWSPCQCCGRPEGGDREEASGYNPTAQEIQSYDCICLACIYHAEYGRLDDATMQEIDGDSHE
jgi:hypothetical protein